MAWKNGKVNDSVFQGEFNFYGEKNGRGIELTSNKITLGYWTGNKLDAGIVTLSADGELLKTTYKDGAK